MPSSSGEIPGLRCTGDGGASATCHKNVIFGDTNVPVMPADSLSNPTQESLWSALDTGCNGGPCKAITIPHNSNLSDGQAFNVPQGSEQHAIKYQKLVEIFQHKGGSECFFDPANPTDPHRSIIDLAVAKHQSDM